jgi:hypothetical protein
VPSLIELVADHVDQGRQVTVLCRSASVRRGALAQMKSANRLWLGVDVTTVDTALTERMTADQQGAAAGPAIALPPEHEWSRLIENRPRLRSHLKSLAEDVSAAQALGHDLGGAREHPAVAMADAAQELPKVRAWAALREWISERAARAAQQPDHVVIACGFAPDPADPASAALSHGKCVNSVWRSLVAAVPDHHRVSLASDGAWQSAGDEEGRIACDSLEVTHVSDVAAEARTAVKHIVGEGAKGSKPHGVLVLYALAGTAERVRAALRRNGEYAAADSGESLRAHGLASLAIDLVPIFESEGNEPIAKRMMVKILSSPMLARLTDIAADDPDPPVPAALDALGDERARLSLRHLHECLAEMRSGAANLPQWITCADAWLASHLQKLEAACAEHAQQENDPDTASRRASAARRWMSAWMLRRRLRALHSYAQIGTFGALVDFLQECGVTGEGPFVRAIISKLSGSADRRVCYEDLDEVLSGGTRSGSLDGRVCMMQYHEYDGRNADLLVALDLHSKGIAALPAPDPVCDDALARVLGRPSPEQVVRERMWLLRCAAKHARSTLAVVTHRGADARAVVRPLQLALDGEVSVHDHALEDRDIPENKDRADLCACAGGERTPWDDQVDAEWCRAGAILHEPGEEPVIPNDRSPKTSSVADYLAEDHRPQDLRGYLGHVGPCERMDSEGDLPGVPANFHLSPSRIGTFTGCMYRGWVSNVLGISAREERDEDLDPAEVGDAVHKILHTSLFDARWPGGQVQPMVVADGRVDQVRDEYLGVLTNVTDTYIAANHAGDDFVAQARAGQLARWNRHWRAWLEKAIVGVTEAQGVRNKRMLAVVKADLGGVSSDELRSVVGDELLPGAPATAAKAVGKVMLGTLLACPDLTDLNVHILHDRFNQTGAGLNWQGVANAHQSNLAQHAAGRIQASLANPQSWIMRCIASMLAHWECLPSVGDRVPYRGEQEFKVPIALAEGVQVPVKGRIDLIVRRRVEGAAQGPAPIEIIDFKTGASASVSREQAFKSLLQPQLGVYGCAFDDGVNTKVVSLTISAVRSKSKDKSIAVHKGTLNGFRERLAQVLLPGVQDGDFALRPHPHACPIITERGAYCDFASACRLRQLPLAESGDGDAGGDGSEDVGT